MHLQGWCSLRPCSSGPYSMPSRIYPSLIITKASIIYCSLKMYKNNCYTQNWVSVICLTRVIWEGVSEAVFYISITLVGILPWCGRQNTQRITQARARLIQQPKRQGQKLAKLLIFWSYKLHNRKKIGPIFPIRLTQI